MIYFAINRASPTGPVKIGYTTNLEQRKTNLAVTMPAGVTFLATIEGNKETEGYIHERFADAREAGEWFRLTDELRQFIQDVQNKVPGIIPFIEPPRFVRRSPAEIAADCMAEAKEMLAFLLGREYRGLGDTVDAAMHRLELKTGIPHSIAYRVRHRPMADMLVSNYFVIKEAYDAELAAKTKPDPLQLFRVGAALARPDDEATP